MKTEFKTKFLQHLIDKKQDKGFTLIELLVVIIIIGILSAIALPSFLNQANKARQSEAKTYIGSMNRTQQAHYLENSAFASNLLSLGLGIQTQTENYMYSIEENETGPTNFLVTNMAQERGKGLNSYVGGVGALEVTAAGEATTQAILCESETTGEATASVTIASGNLSCPADYTSY